VLYANLKRGALLPNISMVPSSRPADSSRRPGSAVGHSLGRGEVVEGDDPYPSRTKSFAGLYVPIAAIGTCRSAKPATDAERSAMQAIKWWSADDTEVSVETIFPADWQQASALSAQVHDEPSPPLKMNRKGFCQLGAVYLPLRTSADAGHSLMSPRLISRKAKSLSGSRCQFRNWAVGTCRDTSVLARLSWGSATKKRRACEPSSIEKTHPASTPMACPISAIAT
jgi:hypothetical protein